MEQPPPSIPGSQRTLAAIVFTDVVGFSARMQRKEMQTVALLQRDFVDMRRICAEHDGAVLKTTGDGLLVRFTSAIRDAQPAPAREVVQGAQVYARIYNLPLMQEAVGSPTLPKRNKKK